MTNRNSIVAPPATRKRRLFELSPSDTLTLSKSGAPQMKKAIFSALLLTTFLSIYAQAQDSTWPGIFQGTVQLGPETRRIVLHLPAPGPDAVKSTSFDIEFFPDYLAIGSLTQDANHLKFTINGGKGSFEGTLSPDGNTLTGTLSLDHNPLPIELHRTAAESAWKLPFRYQYHYKDITIPRPSPDEAKIPFSLSLAVDYMEKGAIAWSNERQCVACHTNGSYMAVRPLMTNRLGPPPQAMHDFFVSALKDQLNPDPDDPKAQAAVVQASTQIIYITLGLALWDNNVTHHLSPETTQALALMFRLQRPTGDWFVDDDNNPPLESSNYQLATVAARAIANAPGWLAQQQGTPYAARIDLLKHFLSAGGKMQGDYDRVDLLWTASEYSGLITSAQKQQFIEMIFAHQQSDGGWSIRTFAKPEEWGKGNRADKLRAEIEFTNPPKDGPASDGHMTGLAIIALRKSGIPAADPHIQRGIAWLLANQRSSGRWWTRSLNRDNWQFISYSSTVYPLLALDLCNALPSNALRASSASQPAHSGK
jgi:squalene-hopene/tetraprenyl-beta-curcumene cyclase